MKLYPPKPPEVVWVDGPAGVKSHTLRSPWALEAWFEPVRWGSSEELLMVSGAFREPIRAWRFRAKLTTDKVDEADYVLFNEFRRTGKGFYFFPWGSSRPFYWMVRVMGTLYYTRRTAPEAFGLEVDLRGTELIDFGGTDTLTGDAELQGAAVELKATLQGSTGLVAYWKPMVTVGRIRVTVKDEGGATLAQSPWVPILHGRVELTWDTGTAASLVFEHDITPWKREVEI